MNSPKKTLLAIWQCFTRNISRPCALAAVLGRRLGEATQTGWAGYVYLEDLLLYLGLDADTAEVLGLANVETADVYCRLYLYDESVGGFSHIRAADFTGLLVFLEKIRLPLDPEPFARLLLPQIKRSKLLTPHELHILWYHRERHRWACDLETSPAEPALNTTMIKRPGGYMLHAHLDAKGQPVALAIDGPRRRYLKPRSPLPAVPGCRLRRSHNHASGIAAVISDPGGGDTLAPHGSRSLLCPGPISPFTSISQSANPHPCAADCPVESGPALTVAKFSSTAITNRSRSATHTRYPKLPIAANGSNTPINHGSLTTVIPVGKP